MTNCNFFSIIEWEVGYGQLGNGDGEAGFDGIKTEIRDSSHGAILIGAHAPSRLKVAILKDTMVFGAMNNSGHFNAFNPARFWVSGNFVGIVYGPGDKTAGMTLPPGEYLFEIETRDSDSMHTLWGFMELHHNNKVTAREPSST